MRKSRFTETEIIYAVKQAEAGVPVAEVARKYGVSLKTIYAWRIIRGAFRERGRPAEAGRGRTAINLGPNNVPTRKCLRGGPCQPYRPCRERC